MMEKLQSLNSRPARRLSCVAALGLMAVTGAAHAGLTLYEGENFGGRSYTVPEVVDNFDRTGFNDRAASLVIDSGTWEICTDAYFAGNCRTLGPGQYPSLGPALTNQVSSVRRVDRVAGSVPYDAGRAGDRDRDWRQRGEDRRWRGGPEITLYDDVDLAGRPLTANAAVRNLDRSGFNDRTRSVEILSGTWELCSDAGFRGECETLGPGRYSDLPGRLGGRVSSLRPVGDDLAMGHGVRLYAAENFRGPSLNVVDRADDLRRYDFANRAGSLVVYEGRWEACEGPEYTGRCRVFGPGEHRWLGWMSDRISSIRPLG